MLNCLSSALRFLNLAAAAAHPFPTASILSPSSLHHQFSDPTAASPSPFAQISGSVLFRLAPPPLSITFVAPPCRRPRLAFVMPPPRRISFAAKQLSCLPIACVGSRIPPLRSRSCLDPGHRTMALLPRTAVGEFRRFLRIPVYKAFPANSCVQGDSGDSGEFLCTRRWMLPVGFHHRAGLRRPWSSVSPAVHSLNRANMILIKPVRAVWLCLSQPTGQAYNTCCLLNRTKPSSRGLSHFIMHWDPGPNEQLV